MNIEAFLDRIRERAEFFEKLRARKVVLLHHNDADGLTAGTIITSALERLGKSLFRYCLEKPYPEVLKIIFDDDSLPDDTVFIITDFGSGMSQKISEINSERFEVIILDHHTIEEVNDSKIHLVNCLGYTISGSSHCSSSSVAFLFALALNNQNLDLAWLAIIGAIGDYQFDQNHRLVGINEHIFSKYAQSKIRIYRDEYLVQLLDGEFSVQQLVEWLNALGSFGYLRGGADVAIKGLREGFDIRYRVSADRFQKEFMECLENWLLNLDIRNTPYLSWFELPDTFYKFGVKSVGLVCELLLNRKIAPFGKYLAGFQKIPKLIPGLGEITINQSKISMRIPSDLLIKVKNRDAPGLPEILPLATKNVGGFSDGCHLHAGASTVRLGDEQKLIAALDEAICNWSKSKS